MDRDQTMMKPDCNFISGVRLMIHPIADVI